MDILQRTKDVSSNLISLAHDQFEKSRQIKELLEDNKDLDLNEAINAAFVKSAERTYLSEVELLFNYGADINATDIYGNTALFYSCHPQDHYLYEMYSYKHEELIPVKRNVEMTQFLLENNADPNIANNKGISPLHNAITRRNAEMAKLLIQYGANLDHRDENGTSVKEYAHYRKFTEIFS